MLDEEHTDMNGQHFGDTLIERIRRLGHPLCVGLDPHLERIPPLFRRGSMGPDDPQTVEAVGAFLTAVLHRLPGRVAVVKPQSAFFEQMGWRGVQLLDRICRDARSLGLLVILDAKRGDIGSTAAAYARAYLDRDAPFAADALTVNPYLGPDSVVPFLSSAGNAGRGVFVLVRTSNPGAAAFQEGGGERPLWRRVADSLADAVEADRGQRTGWSGVGAVVGAEHVDIARTLRELLPAAPFLVPGFGAQGGGARDALAGFVPGPAGPEGGIVNSSRGVLFPDAGSTDDAGCWERAIDDGLARTIDALVRVMG
jgi:orotidine-5'-phosphate decarboxylase